MAGFEPACSSFQGKRDKPNSSTPRIDIPNRLELLLGESKSPVLTITLWNINRGECGD